MSKKEVVEGTVNPEIIKEKIYIVRGKKVMVDRDLAILYEVPTKALNQAVKRNLKRFPPDFMFRLTTEEEEYVRSQFVTAHANKNRARVSAFTEQGIAMLSSVLKSERAIAVNIQIIRIFTKIREMVDAYKELREKVEEMEKNNETNFSEIFRIIRHLIHEENTQNDIIGFNTKNNN